MNDIINGSFEWIGGLLCWLNIYKLLKDKQVRGIYWPVQAFFALWSFWNLYYYPSLNQWFSFVGGFALASGNLIWVLLAVKYSRMKIKEES